HMPLFFFISGVLFKTPDTSRSFRKFLFTRIKARMIPYMSFGLLTYCIWLLPLLLRKHGIYHGSEPFPDSLYYKPLIGMLYGTGEPYNGILWFLPCLLITEILFLVISATATTKHTMLLALLLFAFCGYIDSIYIPFRLPFSINIAFSAVVFYGVGYLLKDYLLEYDLGIRSAVLCLLFGLCIAFLNARADMNCRCYGNPILFYASSLSTIYAYMCFSQLIPSNRGIRFVGQNSLIFFLLQSVGFAVINIFAYVIFGRRPNHIEPNLIYA